MLGFGWNDVTSGLDWVQGGVRDLLDVEADIRVRSGAPTGARVRTGTDRDTTLDFMGGSNDQTVMILIAVVVLFLLFK